MNKRLVPTAKQLDILNYVRAHLRVNGYPPTRQEIANAFGFSSANGVQQHLVALKVKGLLNLIPNISRGIMPVEAKARTKNRWVSIIEASA